MLSRPPRTSADTAPGQSRGVSGRVVGRAMAVPRDTSFEFQMQHPVGNPRLRLFGCSVVRLFGRSFGQCQDVVVECLGTSPHEAPCSLRVLDSCFDCVICLPVD